MTSSCFCFIEFVLNNNCWAGSLCHYGELVLYWVCHSQTFWLERFFPWPCHWETWISNWVHYYPQGPGSQFYIQAAESLVPRVLQVTSFFSFSYLKKRNPFQRYSYTNEEKHGFATMVTEHAIILASKKEISWENKKTYAISRCFFCFMSDLAVSINRRLLRKRGLTTVAAWFSQVLVCWKY